MLVSVVHKRNRAGSSRVINGVVNIVGGDARPIQGVDRPIKNRGLGRLTNEFVDLSKGRAKQMPFFTVDLFKNRVRLIYFRLKRRQIERCEIQMRLRMVAKLEAERTRGVSRLFACGIEKISVKKHGGKSRAIGVAFIERSKHRKYIFKRTFRGVVERKRNQFSIRIDA